MLSENFIIGMEQTINVFETVNCAVGHLQYTNSVNKTVYKLSCATLCTVQTAIQYMYHFSFTQAINKLMSANYTPV